MDIEKANQLRNTGMSYRAIGKELGVSKTTVANKLKFSTQVSPLETVTYRLPPGNGQFAVNSVQQFTGIFRGGRNFYVPADLAIQSSRENARRMWNNLVIREALQARSWAVAELNGHVEAPDPKDKAQAQVASGLQKIIDDIPDFLKMKYCLLKSRFFGVYGVMMKYEWRDRKLQVKNWIPVHGDSIIFKQDSEAIGIYTTIGGGPGVKPVTSEAGYIGRVHVLEDGREVRFDPEGRPYQDVSGTERQAFILMAYDPDPSDFLQPRGAGGVKGLGLRSTLYPTWFSSMEVLGNLMDWLERVGTGITLYKFLRGNQSSYESALQLAESQSNQGYVMVPVEPEVNGGKPLEGVERIEPQATGLDNMLKILDEYFNTQMRRFIVGQDSTSQPVHTGMGSKIAHVQNETFNRIVRFDAADLAQTLSHQLVEVLQEWNFPGLPFRCRYVLDIDRPDVEQQMKAIKDAYDMGVGFDEDEVRSITGMSAPTLESKLLKKEAGPAVSPAQPFRFVKDDSGHDHANDGKFTGPGGGGPGKAQDDTQDKKEGQEATQHKERQEKVAKAIGGAVDKTAGLSDQQKSEYKKSISDVVGRMPPKALGRLAQNVKKARFFGSQQALTKKIMEEDEEVRKRLSGGNYLIKGAYDKKTKQVDLDGKGTLDGKPQATEHFHAHELGHAIDGQYEYSGSQEWQAAWKEEIQKGGLSKLAGMSPHEGFAEFGRLAYTGSDTSQFPKCAAIWKKLGLHGDDQEGGKEATDKKLVEATDKAGKDLAAEIDKSSKLKKAYDTAKEKVTSLAKYLLTNELPAWALEHADVWLREQAVNDMNGAGSSIAVKVVGLAVAKAYLGVRKLLFEKGEGMTDEQAREALIKFKQGIAEITGWNVNALDDIFAQAIETENGIFDLVTNDEKEPE